MNPACPSSKAARQAKDLFVVFQIKGGSYAIGSPLVREILPAPKVIPIPQTPPAIRGIFNLRGKIFKLIDLRIKLGLPPLQEEINGLIQLLHDREQDHRNWLTELESCVVENRQFRMARDPHQCKFGLWYDQYKTHDRLLGMTLPSMDAPHKAIHATANQALQLVEAGEQKKALELIASRREQELAGLIGLFEDARHTLQDGHREVAIVLSLADENLAFSADSVESAEHIAPENIEAVPEAQGESTGETPFRVAKNVRSHDTVLSIDPAFLRSAASCLPPNLDLAAMAPPPHLPVASA